MAVGGAFEDCPDIWEIPDGTLVDGVKVCYSAGDRFLVYSSSGSTDTTQGDEDLRSLHEVKWNMSLHNPCTRKLVNESHGVFMAATKLSKDAQDMNSNQILKISQKYHSILLACIEDLNNATGTEDEKEEYEIQKMMFSEIEILWSLLELLLIDVQSSHRILYQLLGWIQWHFPEPEKKAEEIMKFEDAPHEHPDYWNTVIQFVLHGKMDEGRSLLKAHQNSNREDFRSIDELLRKMPMFVSKVGITLTEFRMRWQHWQDECKRRLERSDFSAESNLEAICKILCGDMETLMNKDCSYLCSTWYIHLISVLLYTEPCITASDVGKLARVYSSNLNGDEPLTRLDSIVLAAMDLDIMKVIKECCTYEDGWWFVTHMNDLLFRKGHLTGEVVSHPICLQEFLIVGYADSLMTHRSLWQIGVDYLDQCVEVGKQYLELYLERIPLDTEAKARKILHISRQRDMESLVKSVCKVMTVKAIQNGMLGTALKWVLESKDVQFATDLAERWIKEYSETGKFECFEILSNLGFCMLVSDKLTFVAKYCEFHKLYREREFKQAASLLVSLLSSGLVPKGFQMVMLYDALPLLEAAEPVFTMEETSQLMACLESIAASCMKNEKMETFQKKERMIRLALARNLARSFIHENSEM